MAKTELVTNCPHGLTVEDAGGSSHCPPDCVKICNNNHNLLPTKEGCFRNTMEVAGQLSQMHTLPLGVSTESIVSSRTTR